MSYQNGIQGILNGRNPLGNKIRFGWGWNGKTNQEVLRFSGDWIKSIMKSGHIDIPDITF